MPILGTVASSYKSAVATSFESIATYIVTSGGTSNVTFSNIPGTYTDLQLRFAAETTTDGNGGDDVFLQFNDDTGTNYARTRWIGSGSTLTTSQLLTQSRIALTGAAARQQSGSGLFIGIGIVDIFNYANTNKLTTTRSTQGGNYNTSAGELTFIGGLWNNSNAVTSIKLTPEQNSFAQHSHFALYGIKSA